ncbi:uncharacterized protein LOC125422275 isoform X2 [Ziziphus jujuba]|uniref:Uncharacterized protein LOC125422275 isoform X2 n=1 Tax=Ziziphus jujuba TaxID=326968 RepID=A0ABM4A018_ZIZJJ|nr:uncharacterized protein LOC125422275 isoform X2 [Ziziphus jujuba]
MAKKKYSCYHSKIESNQDLSKFREDNKDKIPEGVTVERAPRSSINETLPEDEILIHPSTFKLGLCLPFHVLIEEILSELHLYPFQLSPNCWRVMFGIIALNQICKINLGWNEFCHCYAVKKNSGDTYYFSHKKGNEILVTGLPKSEKGWKLDDLIRLKGDCLVPRSKTAADHKPKDVNKCDIEKALEFPNRDWKYLVDHASKLELHIESKKNINSVDQHLKHKSFEEARSLGAESFLRLVDSYINHIKDQDRRIEELKAAYERKDKELEELKLLKKEEAAFIKELKAAYERKNKELEELKLLKKEAAYKIIDKMYDAMTEREEANKPRLPTRMESPSSSSFKNAGHLTSQSQNNHNIEGAADGVTPPNTGLKVGTSPNHQNIDIPGNYDINHQQQQIIEPSSLNNGSHFLQPTYMDNSFDCLSIINDPQQQQQQQIIGPSSLNNSSKLLTLLGQTISLDNSFDCISTINAAAADH